MSNPIISDLGRAADALGLELTLRGNGAEIHGDVDGFPVHAQLNVVSSEWGRSYSVVFRVSPGGLPVGMSIGRYGFMSKALNRLHADRRVLTGDPGFDSRVTVHGDAATVVPWFTPDRKDALLQAMSDHKSLTVAGGAISETEQWDLFASDLIETTHYLVDLARNLTTPGAPTLRSGKTDLPAESSPAVSRSGRSPRKLLTSTDVSGKTFRVVLRGYSEDEVDELLDRVVKTLWEYQADRQGELKGKDVERRTFRVSLRGYAQEEVDQFLDEIVDTLREYECREIEQPTQPVPAPAVTEEGPGPPEANPHTDVPAQPAAPVMVGTPVPEPPTTPEPTPTITRLIVTRPAETGGRPYTVLLDDRQIGKISPGGTERFEIPTGMHWVTMKTRKERSNNQVIEPHEGDQITLTCGPASGEVDDLGRRMEGITLEMAG